MQIPHSSSLRAQACVAHDAGHTNSDELVWFFGKTKLRLMKVTYSVKYMNIIMIPLGQ